MRRPLIGIALVAVMGIVVWQWPGSDAVASAGAPRAAIASQPVANHGNWLATPTADGKLTMVAGGQLVIDAELRRLFDFLLTDSAEKPIRQIKDNARKVLAERLAPGAANVAYTLFERYIAYRDALGNVKPAADATPARLADVVGRRNALRRQFFSEEEANGLFGEEERYDRFTLDRMAIEADVSKSAADKRAALEALENALPPALRQARREPVTHLVEADKAAELRAKGASDEDLFRWRSQEFGAAAASRLGELDREQAAWEARLDRFAAERNRIQADASLSAERKQQAILALQNSQFTTQEQLRLDAALALRARQ
ncbi:lipase secretion chaperone [Parachitinimonas caeni]|uniref:Lipase chaperone n=1 Tax=Parachitinimonas caeni TaxID=3031301 RepID=A0ABT7DW74_9NEIS|nr:lipase secretion chaperone [Parachitinimonas caeni]MDK2124311.1 lipase secretion chaperone [Parachitinimonas caeni]